MIGLGSSEGSMMQEDLGLQIDVGYETHEETNSGFSTFDVYVCNTSSLTISKTRASAAIALSVNVRLLDCHSYYIYPSMYVKIWLYMEVSTIISAGHGNGLLLTVIWV